MTVSSQVTSYSYTGDGASTGFAFSAKFINSSDLKVYLNGVLQTSGYTTTGAGNPVGGTVNFTVPPAVGVIVLIKRNTPAVQNQAYVNNVTLFGATIEPGLDYLTILVQDSARDAADALAQATAVSTLLALGNVQQYLNRYLREFVSVAALRAVDLTGIPDAIIAGSIWKYDATDVSTADNGLTCIIDLVGHRFKKVVPNSVKDFGAVGDGVADDTAAFTAALASASNKIFVPQGTYKITSTISIPASKSLVGLGYGSNLAASGVVGPVISMAAAGAVGGEVSGLRITGTATSALSVNNSLQVLIDNISLSGLTATNGFIFVSTYGSKFTNLWTNGAVISNACFICGQDFNANFSSNWYTSNFSLYNVLIDASYNGGNGSAHGSNWSTITCQGGQTGLYVRNYQAGNFLTVYSENVVLPVRLGDSAGGKLANGINLNGLDLGGPYVSHPQYANRAACINFDNCSGVAINGANFSGAFGVNTAAPLVISGGGGTGAIAIARVTAAGVISSVEVICPGSGYSSAPTVTPSNGTGATFTATVAGGLVTGIAVTAGGSGYTTTACPVAMTYNIAYHCSITGAFINTLGVTGGLDGPLYPWLVRSAGAVSNCGVNIHSDTSSRNSQGESSSAELRKTRGYGYTHALIEYTNSGAQATYVYTPPLYP